MIESVIFEHLKQEDSIWSLQKPVRINSASIEHHTRTPILPLCQTPFTESSHSSTVTTINTDHYHYHHVYREIIQQQSEVLKTLARHAGNVSIYLKNLGSGLISKEESADDSKRTQQELGNFHNTINDSGLRNISYLTLRQQKMPNDIVGTSISMRRTDGQTLFFAINVTSPVNIDTPNSTPWRIWLGYIQDPEITQRIDEIKAYEITE